MPSAMLSNYLKVAWRSVRRRPGLAALNVFGLAVGMAAALLIALYVGHERSFDRFHEKSDRLYRVLFEEEGDLYDDLSPAVARDFEEAFREVEATTALWTSSGGAVLVEAGSKRFYEPGFTYAGKSFFDLFSFAPVHGNPQAAFAQPGTVVLTRTTAQKYFGDANPVGHTLTTSGERNISDRSRSETPGEVTYTVVAVVEAPPSTSTVQFDVLAHRPPRRQVQDWSWRLASVYALLREDAHLDALRERLPAFVEQYGGSSGTHGTSFQNVTMHLQPLVEAHLRPQMGTSVRLGPGALLWIFSAGALLLLLIACVNYANLATARSAERAREVGVRKAVGAGRAALAGQFMSEALLTVAVAFLLALVLARGLLPLFENVVGADLAFRHLPGGVGALLGAVGVVALISGAYPALVLSGFEPAHVLKGAPGQSGRSAWLRKGLVVFQFGASVALVLATVVVQRQMEYVRTERLDTGEDEVAVLPLRGSALENSYAAFKRELLTHPSVRSVSTGMVPEGGIINQNLSVTRFDTSGRFERLSVLLVGDDYLETLGLELTAGHSFEDAAASTDGGPILVNETAASLARSHSLVGQKDAVYNGTTVIGVVRDFHLRSLYETIGPVAIQHVARSPFLPQSPSTLNNVLVRLHSGQTRAGLDAIETVWGEFVPARPPDYYFLDERLGEQYRSEKRLGRIFGTFGLVGTLLAGLGLFGLAAYTVQTRAKEIAIRKTFGASTASIIALLSKDFLKLVALGFALAAPLAWYGVQRWLDDFAYQARFGAGVFVVICAAALAVALAAVGWQAWRAARMNPAQTLRDE